MTLIKKKGEQTMKTQALLTSVTVAGALSVGKENINLKKLLGLAMAFGLLFTGTGYAQEAGRVTAKLVNGTDIGHNDWPQVVFLPTTKTLATANPRTMFYMCTGTLLARDTIQTANYFDLNRNRRAVILTAAHCFDNDDEGRVATSVEYLRGEGNTTGQTSTQWTPNPSWRTSRARRDDVALVWFDGRNGFTDGLPICDNPAVAGDQVTFVGFGCNDMNVGFQDIDGDGDIDFACNGAGRNSKRTGTANVNNVGDTMEFLGGPIRNGDGNIPNPISGDSGSPYIVTQNGNPCIAGIHSGSPGAVDRNRNGRPDNGDTRDAVGPHLHNGSSQAFLTSQLQGLDCDIYEDFCNVRFPDLYEFFYRQEPTTADYWAYVQRLQGDQANLALVALEFRTELFLRLQPALSMLLNE